MSEFLDIEPGRKLRKPPLIRQLRFIPLLLPVTVTRVRQIYGIAQRKPNGRRIQ